MKIKVLHIISGNDNGGGGNHVLNICSKDNKSFENIIGCLGEGPLYSKVKAMDVNFILFSNVLKNRDVSNFINKNSIDIVSFHGAKPFLMHLLLKNEISVPTVAVVHSDFRYDFLNSKIKYFIFTPLSIMGLRSFNNYICISNNLKTLLEEKKFNGSKSIVNNGIDFKTVKIDVSAEDMRNDLKLKPQDFVYVMVARLHPIKNHKEVIQAFKKLSVEFKDVKLLLVGDGELKGELERLISEIKIENNVIFTGNVSNPMVYINCSDVSVLASLSEGGAPPLAVLESGIIRKPLIYTKVGDLESILDENSGYKISFEKSMKHKNNKNLQSNEPIENHEGIYKAMKEAYLDRANLNVKGESLYNIVMNDFTIEKFWKSYFNIYNSILKK
jgi:glycosyltransferase involved in cell wall biosynthesis